MTVFLFLRLSQIFHLIDQTLIQSLQEKAETDRMFLVFAGLCHVHTFYLVSVILHINVMPVFSELVTRY